MHRLALHENALAILALQALLASGCAPRPEGAPGAPYGPSHRKAVLELQRQAVPFRLSGGWKPSRELPAGSAIAPAEGALRHLAALTGPHLRASGPDPPAAAGNLLTALGNASGGVRHLAEARRQAPADARVLNDLGVALRASAGADPVRQIEALDLFDRAVEADPTLLPARFNLALTLQELSLRRQAVREWESLLEREIVSEWAVRAEGHLAAARFGTGAPRPLDLGGIASADAATTGESATRSPYTARRLLEDDLLRAWSGAVATGDLPGARRWLDLYEAMAEALARRGGDRLLVEVAEALREATGSADAEDSARSIESYLHGLRLRREDRCEEAEAVLQRAGAELLRAQNPLGLLAQLYAGICASRRTSAGEIPVFRELLERRHGGYPLLRARVFWMLALRAGARAEPMTAITLRQQAVAAFDAAGEQEMVAALQGMTADDFLALGRVEESWTMRLEALTAADGDPELMLRLLPTAAEACRRLQFRRCALRFRAEEVELARRSDSPLDLIAALAGRGLLRAEIGEVPEAVEDVREALEVAEGIPDEPTRRHSLAGATLALARVLSVEDPDAALRAADDALRLRKQTGDRLVLPDVYLERSRILRRLGSLESAVAGLEEALRLLEVTRNGLTEAHLRISYFEKSRELFDELLATELARGAGGDRLHEILARAQARGLADAAGDGLAAAVAQRAREHVDSLAPGDLLLVYYRLPDALLALRTYRGETTIHRLPGLTPEDEEGIRAWTGGLAAAGGISAGEATAAAHALFERLLRPVWPRDWESGRELVVVPDGILAQLPFSALVVPETGRFLAADHPVRVLPGLGVAAGPRPHAPRALRSILALGDPAFDRELAGGLGRIPAGGGEARDVAQAFAVGEVLVAEAATESALETRVGEFEILHLATHAVDAADPRYARLLLAPDPDNDGVLYAQELGRLDLRRTRLVVLSSCSTAAGPRDDLEGPLTLARAFLAQGVPEVLATLWPVEDDATRRFMQRFYARLRAGAGTSPALAAAQAEAIAASEAGTAGAIPWAAFQLIGGSSRPQPEGGPEWSR